MFIDVSQEMMPDDAEEFAVGSDTTVKHHGELKGSSSVKRKTSKPLLSTEKEGEGESGASATSLEHGKGVCPRSCIVVLPSRVSESGFCLLHPSGAVLTKGPSSG